MGKPANTTNPIPRKCSVEGCAQSGKAINSAIGLLCRMHYARFVRKGDVGPSSRHRSEWGQSKRASRPPNRNGRRLEPNEREVGLCVIERCGAPASIKGDFCRRCYARLRRQGDLATERTPRGEPEAWLRRMAVEYDSSDCLDWPYGLRKKGYGQTSLTGVNHRVIRSIKRGHTWNAVTGAPRNRRRT